MPRTWSAFVSFWHRLGILEALRPWQCTLRVGLLVRCRPAVGLCRHAGCGQEYGHSLRLGHL